MRCTCRENHHQPTPRQQYVHTQGSKTTAGQHMIHKAISKQAMKHNPKRPCYHSKQDPDFTLPGALSPSKPGTTTNHAQTRAKTVRCSSSRHSGLLLVRTQQPAGSTLSDTITPASYPVCRHAINSSHHHHHPLHYCGPHSQGATCKMAKGAAVGLCRTTHNHHTPHRMRPGPVSNASYPQQTTASQAQRAERQASKNGMPVPKKSQVHTTEVCPTRGHAAAPLITRGGCWQAALPQQLHQSRRCCCCWRRGAGAGSGAGAPHGA